MQLQKMKNEEILVVILIPNIYCAFNEMKSNGKKNGKNLNESHFGNWG